MLRRCCALLERNRSVMDTFKQDRDSSKSAKMIREVGTWLYRKETMVAFQKWCRERQVRSYGNIKMCSTLQHARCLRAARPLRPGQGIITMPASACFNFLTVAAEMDGSEANVFPFPLNWMNYNKRLPFLPSCCQHEMATAGWMVRIASLEDSPFTPYVHYLLEDTRGKEGISSGLTREREQNSGVVDHYFSEMATDACEDPEVFLDRLFTAFACLFLRAQPIEEEAVLQQVPGTNFFKAKAGEMHVPTLMPLIDAVPQVEDGGHNTMVQYFPYEGQQRLQEQYAELGLLGPRPAAAGEEQEEQQGGGGGGGGERRVVVRDQQLMSVEAVAAAGGFFALRALQALEEGDVLFLRGFPKDGDYSKARMESQMAEATFLLSHDN